MRLEPLPVRKIDANAQYVGPPKVIRTRYGRCNIIYLQPQRKAPDRTRLHKTRAASVKHMCDIGRQLALQAAMNLKAGSIRTPDQSFSMLLIAKAQ